MPESKETKTNLDKEQIESLIIQQYKDDYKNLAERVTRLEDKVFSANIISDVLYQEGGPLNG